MYPDTSISNIAGTLRVRQKIDLNLFEQAINLFIKSSDGIRLRISLDENGNPCQYVAPFIYQQIGIEDFSAEADPIKKMYEWDSQQSLKPLKLLDSDLFYFRFIKLSDEDFGAYMKLHHIIADAWSIGVIITRTVQYYQALASGQANEGIEAIEPSYITYIENEKEYKASGRFLKDKAYWEELYAASFEATVLKTRTAAAVNPKAKRKTFILPKKFIAKLRAYCTEKKTSPYPLFMAALGMTINRVTEKEDLVLGTPILNRSNQLERNTFGMFVSTIPLRMTVKGEVCFSDLVQETINVCSKALRHQRYPFDALLKEIRERHHSTDKLFDIVLSYQNTKYICESGMEYSTRWHFNGFQPNSLTIHINDRDDDGVLILDYDYHADMYYDKEIEFLHQHLLSLFWHALDAPDKQICRLDMLPEHEKRRILYEFNDTYADYPRQKTLHQLFEEQAERTPDKAAIVFDGRSMTYRELNERAGSLACHLRAKGIKADSVVGVKASRSFEMIIGILAALKAGGAYLYLDAALPEDRVQFMLSDCKAAMILTDKTLSQDYTEHYEVINLSNSSLCADPSNAVYNLTHHSVCENQKVLEGVINKAVDGIGNNLDEEQNTLRTDSINQRNELIQRPGSKPNDLAYIIYTSGSTGTPKGVMVEHRSAVNFMFATRELMGLSQCETAVSLATAAFDIFVFELFSSLTCGCTLFLTGDAERKNVEKLYDLFKNHPIDIVHGTPSFLHSLLNAHEDMFEKVKIFIIGGEQFSQGFLNELKHKTRARIFNGYGPTECTV
ncbi:MAG: condensation domain-containing protein, partial [Clostridia bacterium]|nr:condensation domain-containing protein [Clostridia bacterium]